MGYEFDLPAEMTFASSKFYSFLPAAMFAMAADFLVNLSGAVICGNLLGESALAATNLMQGVFEVVNFVCLLLTVGTGVQFSRELGAFNLSRARGYFTLGVWASLGAGLVLAVVLAGLRIPVLQAFAAASEVTRHAASFWLGYLPAVALEPLGFFLCMMCYADGGSRRAMAACGVQVAVTWAVGFVLTRLLGAMGCALGIFVGYLALIGTLAFHFRSPACMLGYSREFAVKDVLRIVQISLGDASKNIGKAALLFSLNAYVLAKFGSARLPVLAVVVMTLGLAEVFDGIGNAVQPLVSVYLGERNSLLARRVMRAAVKLAIVSGVLVAVVLALFPQLVLVLAGVNEPVVAAEAAQAVRLVAPVVLGFSLVYLFNSYYVFIGREGLSTLTAVGAGFVLPIVLAPLGGALLGLSGVWLGLALAPFAALALLALSLIVSEGLAPFPFLLSTERDAKMRIFDLTLTPEAICQTAEAVEGHLTAQAVAPLCAGKAGLLVEEALMVVRDRNAGKHILAEVTCDLNEGLTLVLRDDGEIFNITDADAAVASLRSYLVSNLMTEIPHRRNLTTTGFNRNVFKL